MGLSCSCSCDWDEYESEPGDKEFDGWSFQVLDFEPFPELRRKRCISCRELIDWADPCLKFKRHRHPYTEIEANINGVDWESFEEPIIGCPPVYQCERCGEIFLNLWSIGFECVYPSEDMNELLAEYKVIHKEKLMSRTAELLKEKTC